MKTKPRHAKPADGRNSQANPKKMPIDDNREKEIGTDHHCRGESYQEIKNRAPETIRTWQDLINGPLPHEGDEEIPD